MWRIVVIPFFVVFFAAVSFFGALIASAPPPLLSSIYSADYLMMPLTKEPFKSSPICKFVFPFSELFFIFGFFVSLVWALYLYSRLRSKDKDDRTKQDETIRQSPKTLLGSIKANDRNSEKQIALEHDERGAETSNKPSGNEDSYPLSFHELAQTHKEWAQLWFTITITVFLGGLIYAIFNVGTHICHVNTGATGQSSDWAFWANAIIPNIFVYALFFLAWHWSARHFRAHWHNFIVNAYRHRALWRYEEIERKLIELAGGIDMPEGEGLRATIEDIRRGVGGTIRELFRLSGVLLLLPGQSSYLEAGQDEHSTEEIVKLEEIVKSAMSRHLRQRS